MNAHLKKHFFLSSSVEHTNAHPLWLFIRKHNKLYYNSAIATMRIIPNTGATDFKLEEKRLWKARWGGDWFY